MWCKYFNKPEPERDILAEMLSSKTRLTDLDNESLLELYRSQNMNMSIFNYVQQELVKRLGNG